MKNGKYNRIFRIVSRKTKRTLNSWESEAIKHFHDNNNLKSKIRSLEFAVESLKKENQSLLSERTRLVTGLYNRILVEYPPCPTYSSPVNVLKEPIAKINHLTPKTLHVSVSIAPEEIKLNPMICKWQGETIGRQIEYAMRKLIDMDEEYDYIHKELMSDGSFRRIT
jgi:hypothetical protein